MIMVMMAMATSPAPHSKCPVVVRAVFFGVAFGAGPPFALLAR